MRILLVLIFLLGISAAAAAATSRAPNFVIILVDDLGWTDGGSFGSSFYETPSIDRLASESLRFTSGYAACPVCSPTRASIQTGKYPARLNATEWFGGPQPQQALSAAFAERFARRRLLPARYRDSLPLEEVTLAEALREGGYSTFFAGKWHLGGEGFCPEQHGYDINLGGYEKGWPEGGYFSPYYNPKLEDGPEGEHLPDRLARESVRFLEQTGDHPFLLMLSFYSVHTPLEGREELIGKYEAKVRSTKPHARRFVREGTTRSRQVHDHAVYGSMVEAMDGAVGKVLAALTELELAENTVVIFLSDNGGLSTAEGSPTSNVPLRAGKGWLYEGGIRVPWLVKWPGVSTPGASSSVQVISNDLYPTILEMAKLPARPTQHIDGKSLVSLIRDERTPDRPAIYWHYPHYSNQGGPPGGAIRAGDWKLIEWFEDERLELFNLSVDIGERNNLVTDNPEKTRELQEALSKWRRKVDAKMPTSNPNWQRKSTQ